MYTPSTSEVRTWSEAAEEADWAGVARAEAASTVDMLAALTHATLALVEQQRISNLIALNRETFASHQALLTLSNARTVEVGEQVGLDPAIAAALGIEVQP